MSLLSAMVHIAHRGGRGELVAFAVAQALFLAAGAMEAGRDEAGAAARALVPARAASVIGLAAYGVVSLALS